MPGPKTSLTEYLADRSAQFGDLGGRVLNVNVLELGPDEATIHATVTFGEREQGRLIAFEHVRVEDGRPHRSKYSYHCYVNGESRFRYDRDPTGHPEMPHHKHEAGRERRMPCKRVTLHDVAKELWVLIEEEQST